MIGRLNHVAIVVPDLAAAAARYRDVLGARVSAPLPLPAHGVTVVFVELANTRIELLEPLGAESPVRGFLWKNPEGGMHPGGARPAAPRRRPRAGRRRAAPRRSRQAGAVPPPQGFLRHPDRAG